MKNGFVKYLGASIIIVALLSIVLSIWMPIQQSTRIIAGASLALFIPGLTWSYVFWYKNEITGLERFIFSFFLSIALVPLVIYFLNKVGVRINTLNSLLEILGLSIVGICIYLLRTHMRSNTVSKENDHI
ncbi:MAG: hypothetical protein A2898_02940 [Candidatus Kerfeldbacteria bacterium RIFCSPLOWO2_01_FULL_48_11]|uniref:DUF1616 domain-containing protein n=1 Tax=Candidatus Kerfeldbacteria bacterium RIFCSPLOWO2_01_FULL_48_11 TaxID=1798543 RepID=A0A1G2B771_9BACT|nr:MAG: Membrane protein containing DUF1616 [Parcubacteria group bacterium GW2011_GWA2_48_9]KKW16166.1 MAG: Membrane protein containing DUF1616 [Parcubacteria group bacterium GW2011_GWC2_49_9]OGY85058.1 MAG: hypothetical protein A2898_02940 [Candidatus Kerfeldbacteria bacterium RIFCSPLOWO2_01_FULL_48_11]HCJ52900.1 hypothetical protein [Candidatus Kerfeldbacteria bacterium]HCM68358.1 hypothetical protein [Candidatus Kerfeldbacteria bacterium]